MDREARGIFGKAIDFLMKIIGSLTSLDLFLMMMLTAVAVFFRYFLNSPVPGDTELMEYLMAIFVPFCILMCIKEDKHISVDFVTERLSPRIQGFLSIVTTTLTLIFYAVVAWQNILYIMMEYESGKTSAVLLIPAWPFIVPIIIMGALSSIILLRRLILVTMPEVLRK